MSKIYTKVTYFFLVTAIREKMFLKSRTRKIDDFVYSNVLLIFLYFAVKFVAVA